MIVKEEGDSSHICQAYDKFVARNDKQEMRHHLDTIRRTTNLIQSGMDQWTLIHVALAAVRLCTPETWVSSFKAVNLHPRFRVSFAEWCARIAPSLQTGEAFHQPADPEHVFDLLPPFFRGMTCAERQKLIDTIDQHEVRFSVECIQNMMQCCHIRLQDMQGVRV